jgi:periplasmic copper chaperone A
VNLWWYLALAGATLSWGVSAGPPAAPEVTLEQAWVRAMPPTRRMTAAYLTVTNTGAQPLVISSASADIAATVEIHTSREVDGLVRMEQLDQVPVGPGQSVHFSPGGMHLMLLEMPAMPPPGSESQLCLGFADGRSACVEAPVRKSAGAEGDEHSHH